jgi:hypothetical protein
MFGLFADFSQPSGSIPSAAIETAAAPQQVLEEATFLLGAPLNSVPVADETESLPGDRDWADLDNN